MKKIAFPLIIFVAIWVSCEAENEEDLFPVVVTTTDTISFVSDIQPLITKSCAISGCHIQGIQAPTLETYQQINGSKDRIQARATVDNSSMPPGAPLSKADKQKINTWIADGAKDN